MALMSWLCVWLRNAVPSDPTELGVPDRRQEEHRLVALMGWLLVRPCSTGWKGAVPS